MNKLPEVLAELMKDERLTQENKIIKEELNIMKRKWEKAEKEKIENNIMITGIQPEISTIWNR